MGEGNCCDINRRNIKVTSRCVLIDVGAGRIREGELARWVVITEHLELLLIWAMMPVRGAFDGDEYCAAGTARLQIGGFSTVTICYIKDFDTDLIYQCCMIPLMSTQ